MEGIDLVDDAGVVLAVELMRCGVPGVRLQVRAIWRHSIARVLKMDMADRVAPEQSYCTKKKKTEDIPLKNSKYLFEIMTMIFTSIFDVPL